MHTLRDLLDHQSGVVARRQLIELGVTDNDIRRDVRNRRLAAVHRGIFVNHTGPLTWVNRAWAAVLFYEGSALCGPSALNLNGDPIHVAMARGKNVATLTGVVVHDLATRVQWNRSPPRLRIEDAVLDVAGAARDTAGAVAVISDACGRRATTPERPLFALDKRRRTPRGVELRRILADAALGTRSVLERDYLLRVERAHRLPRGSRQSRDRGSSGRVHRDVLYEAFRVAVELDGRAWHSSSLARDRDMSRDLLAAGDGLVTLRLGWRHVGDEACVTASRVGEVLRRRGWTGSPLRCGPSSGQRGQEDQTAATRSATSAD